MDKKKSLGQVFTPEFIVDRVLDSVGYTADNISIVEKKLLEPSCGDGAFLVVAVQRFIAAGRLAGLSVEKISCLLEKNICGVEYDADVIPTAITRLDTVLKNENIPAVKWNIIHSDALVFEHYEEFNFVVGNPPYIRLHNMTDDMRAQVKKFSLSSGTTDLYIIFYELGLKWLKADGLLSYIAPNSWLKNASQKKFRSVVINNRQLSQVIDYGSRPIFGKEAATYTAITVLRNDGNAQQVEYSDEHDTSCKWSVNIPYDFWEDSYTGESLNFSSNEDLIFLTANKALATSLGDLCSIQNGVATLRDKIFLNPPINSENDVVYPVVKASTFKGVFTGKIIFPYHVVDDKTIGLSEDELIALPEIYQYLEKNKEDLLKRDSDSSALWFHYGRSQGISNMLKRKLVFSHIISKDQNRIKSYIVPEHSVVYSGLFITETVNGLSLDAIQKIIESEDFCRFLKIHGKDMSGGYKSVGSKPIKSFRV